MVHKLDLSCPPVKSFRSRLQGSGSDFSTLVEVSQAGWARFCLQEWTHVSSEKDGVVKLSLISRLPQCRGWVSDTDAQTQPLLSS